MSYRKSLEASIKATKVEYKQLGRCGLRVSVPILGAMSFGDPQWNSWVLDEEKSLPLLQAAYDRGINTWDTADIYSNGASEKIIGKALKNTSYQNDPEMSTTKDYVNHGGLSRQAIFRAVDASLERLDTPYIDVLQIHRFDDTVPLEETMLALHDLVRSGKIRYIGASSMLAYQFAMMQHCAELHGWTKFVSMQNHYNLLYREEEREMNKFCNLTGVGLIPWAPLCRGILARPPNSATTERAKGDDLPTGYSEVDKKIVQRVYEIGQKREWKMSHVALAWIKKRCASPIIGFSTVGRMDEALEAKGKELTAEEEKYLEELYEARAIVT